MTSQMWSQILAGVFHYQLFMVNQTPITVISLLLMFVAIIATFLVVSKAIREILARRLLPHL